MSITELLAVIETKTGVKPRRAGAGFLCRCPAHEDNKPSLSVRQGRDKLILNCFAFCTFEAVAAALGVKPAELCNRDASSKRVTGPVTHRPAQSQMAKATPASSMAQAASPRLNIIERYPYHDAKGELLFEVCRMVPKDFRQRRPDPTRSGKFIWNLKGVALVPYRLPELLTATQAGETVCVCEGEKDVAALVENGFAATCNAGGAGKWRDSFAQHFTGAKTVAIIADKDAPGRKHAAAVAVTVRSVALSVKVIELPDTNGQDVKDAADFFGAGGTADQLREFVAAAPEFVVTPLASSPAGASPADEDALTPPIWFNRKFTELAAHHGESVSMRSNNGRSRAHDLNESFLAATLSEAASPDAPTVYLRGENRFYSYRLALGIYTITSEEDLSARLSALLLECARACKESCDVDAMEFGLRDSSALAGAVRRAKSLLCVPDDYFSGGMETFLPVANGVLRIADRTLLPFSPKHRFRNRLAVDYVPGVRCPMFEDTLLGHSLDFDDVGLLQRWCGLALVGRNISQRLLILSGTAGAGKGTFIRILKGIVGESNIGSLRTDKLGDRFEIGRMIDRTLLYGADVPANFLSHQCASILKSLTGGDPITVELKGSMAAPSLTCAFNIIVTSNSRLQVHLEGDVEAWQRRLAIIAYNKPKPANSIPDLDKAILEKEGPGVLNWMLDGLYALRSANWQLALSPVQKKRVDELLLESDSVSVFVRERCMADSDAEGMTATDAFGSYADFCMDRGWNPVDRYQFGRECPEIVQRLFRLTMRHDIKGRDRKPQRGWKGLRLIREGEALPE